jgi:hypothetical protein
LTWERGIAKQLTVDLQNKKNKQQALDAIYVETEKKVDVVMSFARLTGGLYLLGKLSILIYAVCNAIYIINMSIHKHSLSTRFLQQTAKLGWVCVALSFVFVMFTLSSRRT